MRYIFFLFIPLSFVSWKTSGQMFFNRVPPSHSNIVFQNNLVENANLNIIAYEYYYNGGGVAIADFNNDGLPDIYFTSNLYPDKLYLNKGNFVFDDVTATANVQGKKGWKTGVSVADVNGDGYVDIYICYSGNLDPAARHNQLFINNGDLTFTEKAKEFGLDDDGYSTQGIFFDYDGDGDLDMYLLNHNIKQLRNFDAAYVKNMVDPYAGDKLFENRNGTFVDVSRKAGIISNPLGYGLGVAVADINNDGRPDIYVSNDYVEQDYLYINNGDGTFHESLNSYLGHISNFSMGSDIADINNDGLPDIYTLDMLPADNKRQKLLFGNENYEVYNSTVANGFYHQIMRNMLQLNNGNGTFSEIGQLMNVSNTDWSWAPLFADFDNDGYKDLFVTNGYGRDMTNRDFLKFYADERLKYLKGETSARMVQMLKGITTTKLHNYIFKNVNGHSFEDKSNEWGFTLPDISNGAAYADLDNDGDLDIVINRLNDTAALYKNMLVENGGNPGAGITLDYLRANKFGIGAKVHAYAGKNSMYYEVQPTRGFQSSMLTPLHIGSGANIDSVEVSWPDGNTQVVTGIKAGRQNVIRYAPGHIAKINPPRNSIFSLSEINLPAPLFPQDENDFKIQPLLSNMLSYEGQRSAVADINNDHLQDLYLGGDSGAPGVLLLQNSDGTFKNSMQEDLANDSLYKDGQAVFFDSDNDGDLDLAVTSMGYDVPAGDSLLLPRLYINVAGKFVKKRDAFKDSTVSGKCIAEADVNADGYTDLFIGGRVTPGRYPEPPRSRLFLNDKKNGFTDVTGQSAPGLLHAGMITDAKFIDVNSDKLPDLVVTGEWMGIRCFINVAGKFVDSTDRYFANSGAYAGWWNVLHFFDMDGDGDTDILAGNCGNNQQVKVSEKKPAVLYYDDFDKNGSIDPILNYYIGDKLYPMPGRDELTDQMVSFRKKFPTYGSYADATIENILSPQQIKNAGKLAADCFHNILFENKNGRFIPHTLPQESEYAPVFAIASGDFNSDGKEDIVLGGNVEHNRIKFGKCDANYGMLFYGDGHGNFTYVPQKESGLNLKGDVRDVQLVMINGKKNILFIRNDQPPVLYKYE